MDGVLASCSFASKTAIKKNCREAIFFAMPAGIGGAQVAEGNEAAAEPRKARDTMRLRFAFLEHGEGKRERRPIKYTNYLYIY